MKTMLISFLIAVSLQPLFSQIELASAIGVPPYEPKGEGVGEAASESAVSAFSHTIDDMALISLGRGLRKAVTLQVITPSADMLIDREIPAGQTRIRIDLSGMPDGAYTVRINLGEKVWVKQIVKD